MITMLKMMLKKITLNASSRMNCIIGGQTSSIAENVSIIDKDLINILISYLVKQVKI